MLASSVQAGPSTPGAGSGGSAPSAAMPPGIGWRGMPMGQRSAAVVAILRMLLGAKKGADWMIEQVRTLLSLGK